MDSPDTNEDFAGRLLHQGECLIIKNLSGQMKEKFVL
jgi:hypothetical protein